MLLFILGLACGAALSATVAALLWPNEEKERRARWERRHTPERLAAFRPRSIMEP
jgi:hypothetical protein